MNARDRAVAAIKAKKTAEVENALGVERERKLVKAEGVKLAKKVREVVYQFQEDFHISKVKGEYAWKITLKPKDRENIWRGLWLRNKEIFVVVEYYTRTVRYCDECDEQDVSSWVVTVQVPAPFVTYGYERKGELNRALNRTTVQDFYCSDIGKFEEEFGNYMTKWYER